MNSGYTRRLTVFLALPVFLLTVIGLRPVAARDLRIASYNVSKVGTTAGDSTERIFRGLKPDVALLQEWDMAEEWHFRPYVDAAFGPEFDFYVGDAPSAAIGWRMNNGIVSRWTILTAGTWEDDTGARARAGFAWSEIDLPGETNLLAVSIHQAAGSDAEDIAQRVQQAQLIRGYVEDYIATQGFDGYIVVGGDINAESEFEAQIDVFETFLRPRDNRPADRLGGNNTNFGRTAPYDWIMPDQSLQNRHTNVVIGPEGYEYPNGIVFESRLFWRLAQPDSPWEVLWNLPPVLYDDSFDQRVDHLAVMKEFDIFPTPTPSPSPTATPITTATPIITPTAPSTPTPRPTATPEILAGPIWGRVYDRVTGQGLANVYVRATSPRSTSGGYTDFNGYYSTRTLRVDTYLVEADTFQQPKYRKQYYNQKDNSGQATRVPSNTGGIDFPLYRRGVFPTPVPSPSPWKAPDWLPSSIDTADYSGDGTSDIAVFRPSTGLWAVQGVTRAYFGRGGDIPVPGDYTGDGTSDIAVFRPSTGLWAVRDLTRAYFGRSGDLPVPGDYRGYGTADFAVFRPSTGLWAIRNLTRFYFGRIGDLPVPFMGAAWEKEIAVFRPSTGLWAIRGTSRFYHGRGGDSPIPGNYRGLYPGEVRFGVFRENSGLWAIRGVTRSYYGRPGDRALIGNFRGLVQANPAVFRESAGFWAVKDLTRLYFGQPGDLPVSGLAVNPSGTVSP